MTFKASQILRILSGILLTTDGWHCGPGNATCRASATEYGCRTNVARITKSIAVKDKAPGLDVRVIDVINIDFRVGSIKVFI